MTQKQYINQTIVCDSINKIMKYKIFLKKEFVGIETLMIVKMYRM